MDAQKSDDRNPAVSVDSGSKPNTKNEPGSVPVTTGSKDQQIDEGRSSDGARGDVSIRGVRPGDVLDSVKPPDEGLADASGQQRGDLAPPTEDQLGTGKSAGGEAANPRTDRPKRDARINDVNVHANPENYMVVFGIDFATNICTLRKRKTVQKQHVETHPSVYPIPPILSTL